MCVNNKCHTCGRTWQTHAEPICMFLQFPPDPSRSQHFQMFGAFPSFPFRQRSRKNTAPLPTCLWSLGLTWHLQIRRERNLKKYFKKMRTLRRPEKTMKNVNPGRLSQMMFYFLQRKLDVLLFDFKCPLTLCLACMSFRTKMSAMWAHK